jgi:signal transduction histidine kinase
VIFKLFRQLVFVDTARSAIKLIVMMGCLLPLWSMAQERAGMLVLDQALALVDAGGRGEQVLVQLPYDWDAEHGARAGKAEFEMAFELPGEPSEPHAVFLPRVGNRFEVWLNGVLISRGGQYGAGDARADFGKSPRFVAIPPTLLQKTNLFRVRIEADSGRAAQLGVMLFGPELPVRQAFDRANALSLGASLAALTLMLAISALCAALWWTQRERLYALASIGAALLVLRLADRLIEHAPLAWSLWSALMTLALCMGLACMGMAVMRSGHGWRAGLGLGVIVAAAAWLASRQGWPNALVQPDGSVWLALVCAAFGGVILCVVIRRFSVASMQAKQLLLTLEERVKQREDELAQSYEKLEIVSREQAKGEERTRILRDMHDGVGAHISAAIRQVEYGQVEHGQSEKQELLRTLRDSLDQLKLSIDAMHLQAGDVTALLANMRYRLEPRLKSSGIELQWAVQMLPEQPQLDHAALRQLQFMLFEAFSNVLQHSGASQLQLSAAEREGRITIALQDNGRGFDPAQPSRGLASMRERAKAIGAEVDILSCSGKTEVEISWGSAHNVAV